MIDNTNTCNECGQLRNIGIKEDDKVDIESINKNFALCCGKMESLEAKLDQLYDQDGNLDLHNKCITNLGNCCNDPRSLITKDYLDSVVRMIVAKLVVEMVSDPAKYLQYAGIQFYTKDGDPIVDRF